MGEITNVETRVEIIEKRINGVDHGEPTDWEDLELFQTIDMDPGVIIVVRGDGDLAHSVHGDLGEVKTIDSPFDTENEYQIIVKPDS